MDESKSYYSFPNNEQQNFFLFTFHEPFLQSPFRYSQKGFFCPTMFGSLGKLLNKLSETYKEKEKVQ